MLAETETIFFQALEANNHDLIQQMLESEQVNANDRMTTGQYANHVILNIALINYFHMSLNVSTKKHLVSDNVETIRILLDAGANANEVLHSKGTAMSLLDLAFALHEPHALDIFDLFIVYGYNVNQDRSLIFYIVSNDLYQPCERTKATMYLILCHGAYTTKADHLKHPFLVNEWPLLQVLYCLQCRSLNYLY